MRIRSYSRVIASSLVAGPALAQGKNRGVKEVESKTCRRWRTSTCSSSRRPGGSWARPWPWPARTSWTASRSWPACTSTSASSSSPASRTRRRRARRSPPRWRSIRLSRSASPTARRAMAELLRAVKKGRTGGGETGGSDEGGDECAALGGVEHTPVDQGTGGERLAIRARVGDSVTAREGEPVLPRGRRREVRRGARCAGAGAAARTRRPSRPRPCAAARCTTTWPRWPTARPWPARARGRRPTSSCCPAGAAARSRLAEVEREKRARRVAVRRATKKTIFISLAIGTGAGYVSGTTEVVGSEVSCCVAPALLHVFPEIGYYFSRRTEPVGRVPHGLRAGRQRVRATPPRRPSGLLRLRYALSDSGEGLQVSGAAGGGIIRHTVKVEQAASDMDTDTTASGPFLVGGGLGYLMPLSGAMNLVAELNALAAFPAGIEEIGPCPGSGCVRPNTEHPGRLQPGHPLRVLIAARLVSIESPAGAGRGARCPRPRRARPAPGSG